MPTSRRDAQFLWRMAGMVASGVALMLAGALLNPIRLDPRLAGDAHTQETPA